MKKTKYNDYIPLTKLGNIPGTFRGAPRSMCAPAGPQARGRAGRRYHKKLRPYITSNFLSRITSYHPGMPAASKYYGFQFTANNPADHDSLNKLNEAFQSGKLQWLVYGVEAVTTEHAQGFLWTTEPKTKQQVARWFNQQIFICVPGPTKGPLYQIAYARKAATPEVQVGDYHNVYANPTLPAGVENPAFYPEFEGVELGVRPTEEEFVAQAPRGQGKRTDLLVVKHAIDAGSRPDNLIADDAMFSTFAAHKAFFDTYASHQRRRTSYQIPLITCLYGPTGSNKTRRAYESDDLDEVWRWTPAAGAWFDGYNGQRTVIFDEFRGHLNFGQILSLTDGYPMRVPIKGGFVHWAPKKIFFTSPIPPQEWYTSLVGSDRFEQFERRVRDGGGSIEYTGSTPDTELDTVPFSDQFE